MILEADPFIPGFISSECKEVICGLLQKDRTKRLGYKYDLEEIKMKKWLNNVRWDDYRNKKVEGRKIARDSIISNFDEEYVRYNTVAVQFD